MIRIAIADDEEKERKTLHDYLLRFQEEFPDIFDIHSFSSGDDLLTNYQHSFDIICLDIDMEGKDGVSTAAEIRREDQDAVIIFITNMAQMAIQGYSVQALDFVLKPVSYYSFAMKMRSAVQIVSSRQSRKTRKIMVNTSGGIQVISSDRLYFIEVERHYLYYHTPDGVFRQKAALKDLENNFNGLSFVRCNNCYLVNLKYVECVDKDNVKVGGTWLRISRPRKKAFLQAITCYMGGINL